MIRTQEPDGLAVKAPAFPAAGAWIENPYPAAIEVSILAPGEVTGWQRRERAGEPLVFAGGLHAGQTFTLRPNESVRFDYAGGEKPPTWHWRVLGS